MLPCVSETYEGAYGKFLIKRTYVLDFLEICGIMNMINNASASRRHCDVSREKRQERVLRYKFIQKISRMIMLA